jgi:hypothetical protein
MMELFDSQYKTLEFVYTLVAVTRVWVATETTCILLVFCAHSENQQTLVCLAHAYINSEHSNAAFTSITTVAVAVLQNSNLNTREVRAGNYRKCDDTTKSQKPLRQCDYHQQQ